MKTRLAPLAAAALALALAMPPASAQSGAAPLDPTLEGQPERWPGAGDLVFSKVHPRDGAAGTSLDFHAAADGRAPTTRPRTAANRWRAAR